jgi:hypothetical protein
MRGLISQPPQFVENRRWADRLERVELILSPVFWQVGCGGLGQLSDRTDLFCGMGEVKNAQRVAALPVNPAIHPLCAIGDCPNLFHLIASSSKPFCAGLLAEGGCLKHARERGPFVTVDRPMRFFGLDASHHERFHLSPLSMKEGNHRPIRADEVLALAG